MAYGKIKADTLVWDNSGSDVETTVQSLTTPAPEGTVVKSTGESGGTKFLREDGDGTCSWQTPVTILDEDDMASDSNTSVPSQQSVKAYVDTKAPTANPTFTGTLTCYDLTVNGTTTTVNSATLTVDDKNIELGKVGTPTDTTADGGGITLKGSTDKTFNWVNATDYWTSSEGIHILEDSAANDSPDLKISAYRPSIRFADISGSAMSSEICTDGDILRFRLSAEVDNNTALTERATLNSSGNFAATGTISDSKGDVRSIPINSQSSAYVLVAGDAGKMISTNSGVTINTSVFSAGDAVSIVNNSGSAITITQGSSFTIYNTVDAATGSRTLAGRGIVTLWFLAHNYAYLSGSGVS